MKKISIQTHDGRTIRIDAEDSENDDFWCQGLKQTLG